MFCCLSSHRYTYSTPTLFWRSLTGRSCLVVNLSSTSSLNGRRVPRRRLAAKRSKKWRERSTTTMRKSSMATVSRFRWRMQWMVVGLVKHPRTRVLRSGEVGRTSTRAGLRYRMNLSPVLGLPLRPATTKTTSPMTHRQRHRDPRLRNQVKQGGRHP